MTKQRLWTKNEWDKWWEAVRSMDISAGAYNAHAQASVITECLYMIKYLGERIEELEHDNT